MVEIIHEQVSNDVLLAWGLSDAQRVTRIATGLINQTYLVERVPEHFILQRLHPSFGSAVHHDIDAVTQHLESKGVPTTRLVRTQAGTLWHEATDGCWRLFRRVEGVVCSEVAHVQMARAAGRAVAMFHEALSDFKHDFHNVRPGAHDTLAHLNRLQQVMLAYRGRSDVEPFFPLAEAILEHGARLPTLSNLPRRIVHGDLKITNLIFSPDLTEVRAIIDLDTLAYGTLATEMGDAFRSWCNPAGESAPQAEVDVQVFAAAALGYAEGSRNWITDAEVQALRPGTETIALELASRFCVDGFEDCYFGWDSARFPSRRAHNLVRTRSQLSLASSIFARAHALDHEIMRAFRKA